jgi:hypothetical protein
MDQQIWDGGFRRSLQDYYICQYCSKNRMMTVILHFKTAAACATACVLRRCHNRRPRLRTCCAILLIHIKKREEKKKKKTNQSKRCAGKEF